MFSKSISGVSIKAITAALPSSITDKDAFITLYGEKNVARVMRGTGISAVRTAYGLQTSDIIFAAVEQLLNNVGFNKSDIDGIIVVTQTPDTWSPGTAFVIHNRLSLSHNCFLLDLNSGCSGYANGLIQAAALVNSGTCENVLLCTGDINTRLINDSDYQIRMLFGDAASATLITKGHSELKFIYGSDGGGKDLLAVNIDYEKKESQTATIGSLKMDGAAVMSFALRRVPEVINILLDESDVKKENVSLFALHQPNEFILNYIRGILDIDSEKLPSDVDGIGNTNSSSIPLLLSRREWSGCKNNIILCGFGVGLAWNAMLLDLTDTHIIKPVEIVN